MTYLLALDQGTTSSRAIAFDAQGRIAALAQREFTQHFPSPGQVEHDADEIWQTQLAVARECVQKLGSADADMAAIAPNIAAIGITNQRETTVLWSRETGRPVAPAIVWQDRRTTARCEALSPAERQLIQSRTGLVPDAYFSATKLQWLLDNVPGARRRAEAGELAFGTVDSWLAWNLSGGAKGSAAGGGLHVTDASNASRTMLMNLHTLQWDDELLALFGIPRAVLPRIVPSSGEIGATAPDLLGAPIRIAGIAGDQQAATFGHGCLAPGMAKNTYGTGCFMLMNTGTTPVPSKNGLLTTVCYQIGDQPAVYALEGSIAVAGSLVQWMRDNLGLIANSRDIEELAASVKDNGGAYFVPAFSGLFAPYWRPDARGALVGLTRYVNKAHIARAVEESTAYQTMDVLQAMNADSGVPLTEIKVDGGMTNDRLLMQFQADVAGVPVVRPKVIETTALGAAYAAGIAVGFWSGTQDVVDNWAEGARWEPAMEQEHRDRLYRLWKKAVTKTLDWVDADVDAEVE